MLRLSCCVACMSLVLLAVAIGGCGSTSDQPGDGAQGIKIAEYVGDGHGGAKPLAFPFPQPGEESQPVQTQTTPAVLYPNATCKVGAVVRRAISWFALPALTESAWWVVTLQPTANEDTDLYVLRGRGDQYADPKCLGYSNRLPNGSQPDKVKGLGLAPDWVPFLVSVGDGAGFPAAEIAVLGVYSGPTVHRFTIEADRPTFLGVNGTGRSGTLAAASNSQWWAFNGTNGTHYTVKLIALSGDPDMFTYANAATGFVGAQTATGGGTVAFTATQNALYHIRVYAYTACRYTIRVTTP